MSLPDSTLDTRLADRVIALLRSTLSEHLTGGVLPSEHEQVPVTEGSGLRTPTVRVSIRTVRDSHAAYTHDTGLVLLVVTDTKSSKETRDWYRWRLLEAIKRVIWRAVDDLVIEHEGTYFFEIVDVDVERGRFFEASRKFVATPVLVTVKTQHQRRPLEDDP